jgi:hypothetical protein
MINIATYADFTGIINFDTTRLGVQSDISYYITKYQEDFLIKLLGSKLYGAFEDGLVDVSPLQKWIDLRDGTTTRFEWNGESYKYSGLKRMIACFVYWFYYQHKISSDTPAGGDTSNKSQNGEHNFDSDKINTAWNEAVKLYYIAIAFVEYSNNQDSTLYPDFIYEEMDFVNYLGI